VLPHGHTLCHGVWLGFATWKDDHFVLPESGVLMIVAGEEQQQISQMRKLRWNGNAYTMGCWLKPKRILNMHAKLLEDPRILRIAPKIC